MKRYLLSLDQGTTSSRAILFDKTGKTIACAQKEFTQYFPEPGWVEHDPREILSTQIECIKDCIQKANIDTNEIAAIGITNQRETTVVWDRKTGNPIYNAIVWQCRRTKDLTDKLAKESNEFREKTGLVPDAYFSGPKIRWILDNVPGAKEKAKRNELIFGTIDTWLIWNLSKEKTHATDASNASRTMLFNIHTGTWDNSLLERLELNQDLLPEIKPANDNFGLSKKEIFGFEAPICGVLGDQQAALFGQACFNVGMAKCTYGTGGFLLVNIGNSPQIVPGLLSTIAWQLKGQPMCHALEGAIFIAGAAIQWLRDGLGVIETSDQVEEIASLLQGNEGVYFVPSLVGLGSPWWNSDVRGTIVGLTRGSNRAHLVRAALEAMAYQVRDVAKQISEFKNDFEINELRVDGGASKNNLMLQFQADLLQIPIIRSGQSEATAWGVASLAGLSCGLFEDLAEISKSWLRDSAFQPINNREDDYNGWKRALKGAFACSGAL